MQRAPVDREVRGAVLQRGHAPVAEQVRVLHVVLPLRAAHDHPKS